MADEKELSEALVRAFKHIRAMHAILAALMIDVAAIRKVVLKGPKPLRRYRHALATETDKVKPLIDTAMRAYDEELLQLRSCSLWRN
jgi:hypothetical protein